MYGSPMSLNSPQKVEISMSRPRWIVAGTLIALLLGACGGPTPQPTPAMTAVPDDNITRITIDGRSEDWARYPASAVDPAGDQVSGSPDLGEIKAFTNDRYLYMFLAFQDAGRFDHMYFNITTGGGEYKLTLTGGGAKVETRADGSVELVAAEFTQEEGYEFRLPLTALQNQTVRHILANVWLGSENGDTADVPNVRALQEVDASPPDVVEAAPTPTAPSEPPVPAYIAAMRFLVPGIAAENIYQVKVRAWSMAIGPNDEILLLGDEHTIYQLEEDGGTTVYADLSGIGDKIEQFGVDPEGRLYVSTNHSGTFRVDSDGQPGRITGPVNRVFDIDSQGNLLAVDYPGTTVQRISPEGEVSVLSEGFGQAHKIAVTDDDEILVVEDARGELIWIHADGSWETIVSGLGIDFGVSVSPESQVYLIDWSGLYLVDLAAKAMTRLDWYQKYSNTGENAVFDSQGFMYTFHANGPIYRIDLEAHTVDMLFQPLGNSSAMAVVPDGRVFMAYGEMIPGGHTTVYQVGSGGTPQRLTEVPYREPRSMSVSTDGWLLLSVKGPDTELTDAVPEFHGGAVFSIDPDTGAAEQILEDCCSSLDSIVQNPTDGSFWWKSWDSIQSVDASGQVRRVELPEPAIWDGRLKFSQDGTLYATFIKPNIDNLTADRAIYRLGTDGTWERLYSGNEFFIDLAVCSDDSIYTMGATFDFSGIAPERSGVLYLLWRLDAEGGLTPLVYDAGTDAFALQCDLDSNQLYFANLEGAGKYILEPAR
jgi:hypothetical protein